MMKSFASTIATAVTAAVLSCGCDDDDHHDDDPADGISTAALCPTTQTLTYANFGMAFFDSYCQRCHGGTVSGAARNGAPADHVFDTVAQIRALSRHIDQLAAAGPAATNTEMPPDAPLPSAAERMQLGEWLACGAP